jgi:hypothetical protein
VPKRLLDPLWVPKWLLASTWVPKSILAPDPMCRNGMHFSTLRSKEHTDYETTLQKGILPRFRTTPHTGPSVDQLGLPDRRGHLDTVLSSEYFKFFHYIVDHGQTVLRALGLVVKLDLSREIDAIHTLGQR